MSAVTITVLRFWNFAKGSRRTGTVVEKGKQELHKKATQYAVMLI